jgi:membrane protein
VLKALNERGDFQGGESNIWLGAAVTALLFTIGKFLIGLYLGQSAISSAYGAAGSVLVILICVYYSAQILFLGAEFTRVNARRQSASANPGILRHSAL